LVLNESTSRLAFYQVRGPKVLKTAEKLSDWGKGKKNGWDAYHESPPPVLQQ
jgi:hypothetical protein